MFDFISTMAMGNAILYWFCILLYFLHLTRGLPQNPTRDKQVQSVKENNSKIEAYFIAIIFTEAGETFCKLKEPV